MNRWIVGAGLFAVGIAVGLYYHRLEVRTTYELQFSTMHIPNSPFRLKSAIESMRSKTDVKISLIHGVVLIESPELDEAERTMQYLNRLAEEIAKDGSVRIVARNLETANHSREYGDLARSGVGGFVAGLCWIRFAPRKRKEPTL